MTGRYAAMLRAVNVGGRKLAMADLKRVAAGCNFTELSTLLASGNLLFNSALAPVLAAETLRAALLSELGLASDVFVRDRSQLDAVLAGNPFPDVAREQPKWLSVVFLDRPPPASLKVLEPACDRGEQVRSGSQHLYIWTPQGIGESKLSAALIERRLDVRGTGRNWNTLGKLVDALGTG